MVGYSINGIRTSIVPFVETDEVQQMVRLAFGCEDTMRLLHACKENGIRLCSVMAAATLLAAPQLKKPDSSQPKTYTIATLINCCQVLEPALDDHKFGCGSWSRTATIRRFPHQRHEQQEAPHGHRRPQLQFCTTTHASRE